ncbi:dihydroorotate dehydrogenase electron transfer subunit [Pseudogracilibacillus auburnensis]|uniref:Dihydroorotate dehydrogenase B (NAD(+)), electron transfer subunit n=1 Tax=Pseudogracilibacillus auburnensis TaxID=1494959 RepID=A0A2V3W2H5_9BACI|nr:dihydroorotate dehydrogenase electron transfer subunit [Pseudogracilibacillus auburnensis]PXW88543.1 dihydroorotate oxidase B electron transfer subunit [Pseudogracilibacillus auburnensis]
MIKKEAMKIISSKQIATDTVEMVLENEYISNHATPGQFLHIAITGHTLRRPLSIAAVDSKARTVTILFKIIGSGTETLATYQVGETIDVLGPNGNGFPVQTGQKPATVLLIGGGIGVPPIYFLGTQLKKFGIQVQSIIGFQSRDYVFYENEFQALGETFVVTNDGSYGYKGFVTDVLDKTSRFDRYYSCGPLPMLRAVSDNLRGNEGYLSFEERMGCGVGACYACVIPTEDEAGYKKICQDGPVFRANEVIL